MSRAAAQQECIGAAANACYFLPSVKSPIVVIIGTGNLALGLAYYLKQAGYAPRLLSRDGALEMAGFRLSGMPGEAKPWVVDLPAARPEEIRAARVALVAVKSYQLRQALAQHLPALGKGTVVIPVGNGAVDREIQAAAGPFSDLILRLGITTIAVSDDGQGKLRLRNPEARVEWGPLDPPAEATPAEQELVANAGTLFHWNAEILIAFRKKWLFNTVINSLCGVMRLRKNGWLLRHRQALMRAFSEAFALAEEHWGEWPAKVTAEALFAQLLALLEATFENENSMAKDVRLKRPTETGQLAGLAQQHEGFPFLRDLDARLRGELVGSPFFSDEELEGLEMEEELEQETGTGSDPEGEPGAN